MKAIFSILGIASVAIFFFGILRDWGARELSFMLGLAFLFFSFILFTIYKNLPQRTVEKRVVRKMEHEVKD